MPLAAHAVWIEQKLDLQAAWGDLPEMLDTATQEPVVFAPLVRAHADQALSGLDQAAALGQAVATQLYAGGAIGSKPVA